MMQGHDVGRKRLIVGTEIAFKMFLWMSDFKKIKN